MRRWIIPAAIVLASAASVAAQPAAGCLDLTQARAISLTGRLAVRTFPGSPNFESVAKGDEAETVFILTLPRATCANDGEFITADLRFRTVHVFANDDALTARLRRATGRAVTVMGEAFGAHTGHHHAPLVLSATALRPAR